MKRIMEPVAPKPPLPGLREPTAPVEGKPTGVVEKPRSRFAVALSPEFISLCAKHRINPLNPMPHLLPLSGRATRVSGGATAHSSVAAGSERVAVGKLSTPPSGSKRVAAGKMSAPAARSERRFAGKLRALRPVKKGGRRVGGEVIDPREYLEFYRGGAVDWEGASLEEILSWPPAKLEGNHNYIQWLFNPGSRKLIHTAYPTPVYELAARFVMGYLRQACRYFRLAGFSGLSHQG